jgi:hypothetical protein
VPVRLIKTICTVGERFVYAYLHRRGFNGRSGHEMEGHITEVLSPSGVLGVVRRGDAEFDQLTGASEWRWPLM